MPVSLFLAIILFITLCGLILDIKISGLSVFASKAILFGICDRLALKISKFRLVDKCPLMALPSIPVVPISNTLIDTTIQLAFYPPEIRREISSLWEKRSISSFVFNCFVFLEV